MRSVKVARVDTAIHNGERWVFPVVDRVNYEHLINHALAGQLGVSDGWTGTLLAIRDGESLEGAIGKALHALHCRVEDEKAIHCDAWTAKTTEILDAARAEWAMMRDGERLMDVYVQCDDRVAVAVADKPGMDRMKLCFAVGRLADGSHRLFGVGSTIGDRKKTFLIRDCVPLPEPKPKAKVVRPIKARYEDHTEECHDALLCPRCLVTWPGRGQTQCPTCGVSFGEPRDLPEDPDA